MVTVVQSFLSSANNQATDFLSMQQLRSDSYEVSQSIKRKINYFLSKHQAPTQWVKTAVAPIKAKRQIQIQLQIEIQIETRKKKTKALILVGAKRGVICCKKEKEKCAAPHIVLWKQTFFENQKFKWYEIEIDIDIHFSDMRSLATLFLQIFELFSELSKIISRSYCQWNEKSVGGGWGLGEATTTGSTSPPEWTSTYRYNTIL